MSGFRGKCITDEWTDRWTNPKLYDPAAVQSGGPINGNMETEKGLP